MASLTVEGVYRDGKVELTGQAPQIAGETRVLVTFLPAEDAQAREALRQQAFAQMKEGIDLGGPPYPKREELYEAIRDAGI